MRSDPPRLLLQVNTDGVAWRDLIEFARDDDIVCAHVLTSAPLLAAAGGPRTRLRICTADAARDVHSLWSIHGGWQGSNAAAEQDDAADTDPAVAEEIARDALHRLHGGLVNASQQVCRIAAAPSTMVPDFRALRARIEYAEHALAKVRRNRHRTSGAGREKTC